MVSNTGGSVEVSSIPHRLVAPRILVLIAVLIYSCVSAPSPDESRPGPLPLVSPREHQTHTAHLREFEEDSRSEVFFWIDEWSIEFGYYWLMLLVFLTAHFFQFHFADT